MREILERSDLSFETDNYNVNYYKSGSNKLIIVFISAGRLAPGQPVEEFRKSLQDLDVSLAFVLDKHVRWFNYDDTKHMFDRLNIIASKYAYVGSMGESMGGAGALLSSKYLENVSRILALSPQYSICSPFIRFDLRYEAIGRSIPHHFHASFSRIPLRGECVILYGNTDWCDFIHATSFLADGMNVRFVDGATHNVASFLKNLDDNKLIMLLKLFAEFENIFSVSAVDQLLSDIITAVPIRPGHMFVDEYMRNENIARQLDARLNAEVGGGSQKISIGKTASQSSVCVWSRESTVTEDAQGAISGHINGVYSFHTDYEKEPWWLVDLHEIYDVDEVRLFNYLADPAVSGRASKFVLEVSLNLRSWSAICERDEDTPFGGADGRPFVWRASSPVLARYVRVRLTTTNWLHLDQVEVYGKSKTFSEQQNILSDLDIAAEVPNPNILVPRDGERIDCSAFVVAVGGLDSRNYLCTIQRLAEGQDGDGESDLFSTSVNLVETNPGIWVASFFGIEKVGNYTINVSAPHCDGRILTQVKIVLGISAESELLRQPSKQTLEQDLIDYPIKIIWNRLSNIYHISGEVPVVLGSSERGWDTEITSGQVGPSIIELYGVERHDARSVMLKDYCIGVDTEAFLEEFGRGIWETRPGYTATFHNADIYMRQGVIVDSAGIWGDSSFAALVGADRLALYPDMFEHEGKIGRVRYGAAKPTCGGVMLALGNAGFGNFAHWMMNSFLAVYLLKDEIARGDARILSPTLPLFARQSLRLLGLEDRVFEVHDRVVRVDRLVYPSHLSTHANMKPSGNVVSMVSELKALGKVHDDFGTMDAPELIYLTRRGFPSSRNMINEDILFVELSKIGFRCVATHDLSFVERIRVFSNAKIVIGQLGAALSHILFVPKGSVFVEITTKDWHSNEYWYLAKLLDVWFVRFMLDVKREDFINRGVFSFEAPVEEVIKQIKNIQRDFDSLSTGRDNFAKSE